MSYDNFLLGAPYSKVYVTLTFENHETVKFDGKLIALLTFTSNPSFTEVRDFFNSKTNLQYTIGDFVYYLDKYEYSFCCIPPNSFQFVFSVYTDKFDRKGLNQYDSVYLFCKKDSPDILYIRVDSSDIDLTRFFQFMYNYIVEVPNLVDLQWKDNNATKSFSYYFKKLFGWNNAYIQSDQHLHNE